MTLPLPNRPVWALGLDELELPSVRGVVEADVCVVGLGGSGLAAIGELARRGRRVVGIDAGRVGGGAAGRNGGFFLAGIAAFHHHAADRLGRELATTLYRLTLAEMDRMAEETPALIRRVGSLRIAASPEELRDCERQLAVMREDGLPVEAYDGPEGRGLLVPGDGVFQPLARCRTLAERLRQGGVRLFERSRATEIAADRVVTDEGEGEVRCEQVLVAVDGRLEALLPELRGRIRTARLQMLATAPAPEVRFPRPVYARYGYDYWQQLPDGSIALGGARDLGGDDEWTHDAEPTLPVQQALDTLLRERLGVRAPVTHRWAASVGYTENVLPIADEVRPGVWAIGGYSGTGNVVGAMLGRAAAAMLVDGRSELVDRLRRAG